MSAIFEENSGENPEEKSEKYSQENEFVWGNMFLIFYENF